MQDLHRIIHGRVLMMVQELGQKFQARSNSLWHSQGQAQQPGKAGMAHSPPTVQPCPAT